MSAGGAAAERARTIASLRQRIASLGGLPGAGPPRARAAAGAAGVAPARDRLPSGFASRPAVAALLAREAVVDLAPLLERSGAAAPPTAAQLAGLVRGARPAGPAAPSPGRRGTVVALDIESLGLRGSGVLGFLVGIAALEGGALRVEQLLLADPGAERAMLVEALARLGGAGVLLSYNGRSFDVPVLQARCTVNRLDPGPLGAGLHCDLLGPVRRLFRDRLDSVCTLRRAESSLLGLERVGDVGGSEAPWRYRAWLGGGPSSLLDPVVGHNQLDLCATVVLAARLAAHVEGRLVEPGHPADRYRLGLHLDRSGADERSAGHLRAAFAAATAPWSRAAGLRLAQRLRRAGGRGDREAEEILRELLRRDPLDLRAGRALAILLERQRRDREALELAERAARACDGLPPWRDRAGAPVRGWRADWERRALRLRARLARRAA